MLNLNLSWFSVTLISYLTKHEARGTSARGSSAQERNELIANLPEASRLATVCEDAGLVKAVSIGPHFMRGLNPMRPIIQVYVENLHILKIILLHTAKDELESIPNLAQPWKLLSLKSTTCTE